MRKLLLKLLGGIPVESVHEYAVELVSQGPEYGPSSGAMQREATAARLHHLALKYSSLSSAKRLTFAMIRTTKRTVDLTGGSS